MKTARARGLVLQYFQQRSGGPLCRPRPEDFSAALSFEEIFLACDTLDEHGLIEWKSIRRLGGSTFGCGRITRLGQDVLIGQASAGLDIVLPGKGRRETDRSDGELHHHLEQIRRTLETCDDHALSEARRQLCALLDHPRLVTHGSSTA